MIRSKMVEEKMQVLGVGETTVLAPVVIHPSCAAELSFASSDETVATVAADGTVTAVAPGTAEITVTATLGDVSVSTSCRVVVFAADASMLAFETRTNSWQNIGRLDVTSVTPVSEAQDAVIAATYVGDKIYGYDAAHNFFVMDGEGFNRTVLGNTGLELGAMGEIGADFMDIRGIAYDAANDRLLVVATKCNRNDGWIDEYVASTTIYQVNLENGNLTALLTLGEDMFSIRGLTVDGEGNVYVYSAFDDYFSLIDMTTGAYTHKCSLQTLSIYGSAEHNMPMAYDAATGLVYCLFTSNGSYHTMLTFNPETAQVKQLGEVGSIEYNPETWMNEGPTFSALLIK